jgi:hypothetical protein
MILATLDPMLTTSCQSRLAHEHVIRVLYQNLYLKGTFCDQVLQSLVSNPDVTRHVHVLALHADYGGRAISLKVAAAAQHMPVLHTFSWEVPDALPHDEMWYRLQDW